MIRYFRCDKCGNLVESVHSSGVPMVCCGEKMRELVPGSVDAAVEKHVPVVSVEGSVVRVAPAGERSVRNNGTEPLVMLCVQYRGGTFTAEDAADGTILSGPVKW